MSLEEIYAAHPLREETILRRIRDQGFAQVQLSEWHLAIDSETDITDQNHSGGIAAVLDLALAAGIRAETRVADVGAGLAGSARVLASAFSCQVDAYERDQGRCRDALRLTRLVQLEDRVAIIPGDALELSPPACSIDVVWGQAAWVHFAAIAPFLQRWVPALRKNGRVAMTDAHLLRPAETSAERVLVARLEDAWSGHLRPVSEWSEALNKHGASRVLVHDRTYDAVASCERLIRVSSRWPDGVVNASERESWRLALQAFNQGLVGEFQTVAFFDSVYVRSADL